MNSKSMKYSGFLTWCMALLMVALAAGCGGGGDGGRDPILGVPTLGLVSVAVTPATASIPIAGIQAFTATATYSDGTTRDVTASSSWTSGTASVATVNSTSGVATGVAGGTSVITANFGGKTNTANLTVTAASLVSIAVTPATASIPISGVQALMATATYSDGTTRDVTSTTSWTSGTVGVATVNSTSGIATGVSVGTSIITASFGGKTNIANLTVTASTLVSIAVTPATASIPINSIQAFKATATYSDATTRDVTATTTWTSATTSVATVNSTSGVATGVSGGTSVITASFGGKTNTANLTVTAASVVSIAVTPATASIPISGTQAFTATATFSDATTRDVTATAIWTSGTTSVATVLLSTGVATGISGGTSVITASFGGKTNTANLTVTAASVVSIAVTPATPSIAVSGTQAFTATATYSDATTRDVTATSSWTSGTTSVATVLLSTGVATGVTAGTSVITASFGGKTNTANLTVTAAAPTGPAPVNLGTAGNFVILAKSGVSTTGTTAVVGDIGISPAAASFITGFGLIADSTNTFSTSSLVTGKLYAADYAPPTPSNMTTAIGDMQTAYTDAAGRTSPDFTELYAGDISGRILVPGLYKWGTGVSISSAGVTLTGGANDVWIFQIAQNLTVSNSAIVTLSGGAQAKNVFWQVAGQATLGTSVNFKGIILSQTLISLNTGAVMTGRTLAQTAVTLNANNVTAP